MTRKLCDEELRSTFDQLAALVMLPRRASDYMERPTTCISLGVPLISYSGS